MSERIQAFGVELECFDAFESRLILHGIPNYFSRAIRVEPGMTVVDAGANIGLFSAAIAERTGGEVRLLAFEPLPPIFQVLERNVKSVIRGRVELFPIGLGRNDTIVEFYFFPQMSSLSTQKEFVGFTRESARIGATVAQLIKSGAIAELAWVPDGPLAQMMEGYVESRFTPRRHHVRVRPLSDVLAELELARIDLLKVDVEGAELEVLAGIRSEDFARIEQIVVEVDHFSERGEAAQAVLAAHGFTVAVEQSAAESAGDHAMVFGTRS